MAMNQALKNAEDNAGSSASVCNDWARAIAKYKYLRHRIEVLRQKVSVLKELCQDTEDWLNTVENNVTASGIEDTLRAKALEINATPADDPSHAKCDKKLCVHGDKTRFVEDHKKAAKAAQIAASLMADVAEPQLYAKDMYTKGHYEKPKG